VITTGRELHDDPFFFEGCLRLRESGEGINDLIEVPALKRMLPPVAGAAVVELGRGAGTLPSCSAELVASSLDLRYVADHQDLTRRVARWPRRHPLLGLGARRRPVDPPDGGV